MAKNKCRVFTKDACSIVNGIFYYVGDIVSIDSYEGFGGPAHVVAVRTGEGNSVRVRMCDGSQPDFWAHNHELKGKAIDCYPKALLVAERINNGEI